MSDFTINFPSPVEKISFRGSEFFLKRDDLLHADFSGNKARKFHYFLEHDLPNIQKVISYGSNQSNAMYSLSVLAKVKGWEFEYFVDHIPEYLRKNPVGNYAAALKNGMTVKIRSLEFGVHSSGFRVQDEGILWIEEGGRQKEAEYGIRVLAEEIAAWQIAQGIKHLDIFLPSGTGTTALYLQKALRTTHYAPPARIYTTPCVGDGEYLRAQFAMLEPDPKFHPTILDLPRKYHFGKLYREFYEIWIELHQHTGVEFDLLYDPLGWLTLLAHREKLNKNVMYIHQGGLLGNESMLPRYRRKYPDIKMEIK